MKKTLILFVLIIVKLSAGLAQSAPLPLTDWAAPNAGKFIFYISGDGGINNFSQSICKFIHDKGYSVSALNSKIYFWERKTPEQTAKEINAWLLKQMNSHPFSELVMIGYSFGADVLPFVTNRLLPEIKSRLHKVLLISPSTTTDFEIHWADIFGLHNNRSMNVASEINKLRDYQVVTFFGSNENDFNISQIRLPSYHNEILGGGHHFDGKPEELSKALLKYIE
jgi:type IV secretory pathway VirJ component